MFGTPLVCRVVPMTGRQLYDKLYRRFHRFLRLKAGGVSAASPGAPPSSSSSSSANPPSSRRRRGGGGGDPRFSGGATAGPTRAGNNNNAGDGSGFDVDSGGDDDDDAEDFGVQPCMGTGDDRDCPRTVRATSAWVAAGEVNRWGFRLRLVESSGYACSRCRWTEGCVGCFIRPDDEPCPVRAGDSVGVDWHISVIKVRAMGRGKGGGRMGWGGGAWVCFGDDRRGEDKREGWEVWVGWGLLASRPVGGRGAGGGGTR